MVGRRRACHAIITLGQHTGLDYVGRVMSSLPLDNKHEHVIIALCWNTRLDDVKSDMLARILGNIHGRTMLSMACHNRAWAA